MMSANMYVSLTAFPQLHTICLVYLEQERICHACFCPQVERLGVCCCCCYFKQLKVGYHHLAARGYCKAMMESAVFKPKSILVKTICLNCGQHVDAHGVDRRCNTAKTATSKNTLLAEFADAVQSSGCAIGHDAVQMDRGDALFVIDMQYDFLPGGSFGVAEGDQTVDLICDIVGHAVHSGVSVYASRDYHPSNHCSFASHGGPFPPHCVQGSHGSNFHENIAHCLQHYRGQQGADVNVVFKGFSPDVDSFSAVVYSEETAEGRLSRNPNGSHCALTWTGGYILRMSNVDADINAPPDVMSILTPTRLCNVMDKHKKVFVVGLALDFCVMDTAVNAARTGDHDVYIILDACRAAHITGVGHHGTGFLTNPAEFAATLNKYNIKLVLSKDLAQS